MTVRAAAAVVIRLVVVVWASWILAALLAWLVGRLGGPRAVDPFLIALGGLLGVVLVMVVAPTRRLVMGSGRIPDRSDRAARRATP